MALPFQERRGQAPGSVDQGKPQEMDHPPSARQKLPVFFHEFTFKQSAISSQLSAKTPMDKKHSP
jgi:hypothetical protein